MKTHCLINIGSGFAEPDKVAKYVDKLDGDVIAFTYARMHLDEINSSEWHALHFYASEWNKKRIKIVSNLITCMICKPKEVYFLGKAGVELFFVAREQWPTAKIFTEKQILN